MSKDFKEILILVILIIIAAIIIGLLITTGQEPSYVLTCENAETLEAYKSCMYLNNKIN